MKSRVLIAAVAAVLSLPLAAEAALSQTALTSSDIQIATAPASNAPVLAPAGGKAKKPHVAKPAKTAPAASQVGPSTAKAKPHARKTAITATPLKPLRKGKGKPAAEPLPTFVDQPQDGGKLTGSAAWAKLVGNSVIGRYDGQNLVDGYLPDGTVKTKLGDAVQVGRWGLVDEKVCFQYAEPEATCYGVEMDGSAVILTSPEGENILLSMTPGLPTSF